jgi:hypothetical protein
MSDIQALLNELGQARVTTTVLNALDTVVPGEWVNVTSLEQAVQQYLGVSDPGQVAAIVERARSLYASRPHYSRAVTVFQVVDTADKAVAAAVAANTVGNAIGFLNVLDKVTPKPDTAQAVDAAVKLAAEVAAFALLRGLPVHSLAEAKAFPAALATYAKADMMRLAAWITIDGMLPLGPQFVQKIVDLVSRVDTTALTNNPVYARVKDLLPGSSPDEQKGFILSTLQAGSSYVTEFVRARGLTQEALAGKFGSLVNVADKGMDVLAATLDATTNYYSHTGVQSVARVLVSDAQTELANGVPASAAPPPPPTDEGSSWFKTAATVGGAGVVAAGLAAGAGALLWKAFTKDDDDEADDGQPDAELDGLDDNAIAARETALEMEAKQVIASSASDAEKQQMMDKLARMRRRLRRARRRHRMAGRGMGRFGGGRGMRRGMRG